MQCGAVLSLAQDSHTGWGNLRGSSDSPVVRQLLSPKTAPENSVAVGGFKVIPGGFGGCPVGPIAARVLALG
jgi:hypothetical protein